jgi:hypothetical protein
VFGCGLAGATRLSIKTFSITTLCINDTHDIHHSNTAIMLSVVMLNVVKVLQYIRLLEPVS